MAAIYYNVYYSTTSSGPWTLSNSEPIPHVDGDTLYEHRVTGLNQNAIYYFIVVGGTLDGTTFTPLITQSLTPSTDGAKGVGIVTPIPVAVKVYAPNITTDDILGHTFEVI